MENGVISNKKCRVFIRSANDLFGQLFTLSQSPSDGSIYLHSPEITEFEWIWVENVSSTKQPIKIPMDTDGHLSIHASGITQIRPIGNKSQLRVIGHHLLNFDENSIGARHLFTLFPKKPFYAPDFEITHRETDQIIVSTAQLTPFVAMVFALPRQGLNINFEPTFKLGEEVTSVTDILGAHLFPLIHHDIFIFFYHTTGMEIWPEKNLLQYLDGLTIPKFIGDDNGEIKILQVQPSYKLSGKNLSIKLP